MSQDYYIQKIDNWKDGIPFDEFGHALRIDEMYDKDGNETEDIQVATDALELTNPYGVLAYGVGDDDYFFVFDYGTVGEDKIALHSTVNSESGGFIDCAGYEIVHYLEAKDVAQRMLDAAFEALSENNVRNRGWGKTGYKFVEDVRKESISIYKELKVKESTRVEIGKEC